MRPTLLLLPSLLSLLTTGPVWAGAPAARVVPVLTSIPRTYLVFGYGTDRQGKGPYLDRNGTALAIGGAPRMMMIQGMGRKVHVRIVLKPALHKTPNR